MKRIITGGILLFSGIVLYVGIYIPAAFHAAKLGGWTTPPGRLGTALNDIGGTDAIVNAEVMMTVGVILLIWGCFGDDIAAIWRKIKRGSKSGGEAVEAIPKSLGEEADGSERH